MILTNDVKSVGVALAATPDLESRLESRTALKIDPAKRFELTAIGEIVDKNWRELPNRFPAVTLDEYVIMPNHFHGIVFINSVDQSRTNDESQGVAVDSSQGVAARATPTLGTIVGTFKSKSINDTLVYIAKNRLEMIGKFWQRNYFEKIIRNEKD